ncbi:hypothetical protein FQA39_LY18273 [Lamprigera yunnana]|nr:hypothetical protein FQA39_LY18273 [Lamprigera yunnana]
MKVLLSIVLCLAPVIFTKYTREEIVKDWNTVLSVHKIKCIKESGVNKDDAMDIEKTLTFPDYRKFQCYIKCLQENLNILDTKGNFNEQTVEKLFVATNENMIHKCVQETSNENNNCKMAYDFAKCIDKDVFADNTKCGRDEIVKDWDKVSSKYKIECIKETGVNEDDAIDIEKILSFPDYQNFKCYIKCLQQNMNCLNTKGNFNEQAIEELIADLGIDEEEPMATEEVEARVGNVPATDAENEDALRMEEVE